MTQKWCRPVRFFYIQSLSVILMREAMITICARNGIEKVFEFRIRYTLHEQIVNKSVKSFNAYCGYYCWIHWLPIQIIDSCAMPNWFICNHIQYNNDELIHTHSIRLRSCAVLLLCAMTDAVGTWLISSASFTDSSDNIKFPINSLINLRIILFDKMCGK